MDLAQKLQIKPGQSVALIDAPLDVVLPSATVAVAPLQADVVIGFVILRADLDRLTAVVSAALDDRLAWIGYPKGGKLGTDLNRDRLVQAVAAHGVQPVRQVSIDDTWSALRFRPAT
jgi:hypothetical protein